jgi:hypothetical protein
MRKLGLLTLWALALPALAACTTSPPLDPPVERVGSVASALESCTDGADNDLDGLLDCVDPSCSADPACATQIACDGDALNVRADTGILWRVDVAVPNLGVLDLQTLGAGHNAMGYNIEDGFFYAVRTTDLHFVKIARNPGGSPPFVVTDLGAVQGLTIGGFAVSAGFDMSGNWWSTNGNNQIMKVDVSVSPLTAQIFTITGTLPGSDMAFDPDHNRFYSVNGDVLTVLDMATLVSTTTAVTGVSATGPHGSQWFDADGFMYVISNGNGLIRQIDVNSGVAIAVGAVAAPSTPNDGAACPLAAPPFEFCVNNVDDDGDGVIDENSGGNNCIVIRDSDGDGVPNIDDVDDDNDGIPDVLEIGDTDGDGVPDRLDLDSDNDGINDAVEAGHAGVDANADGMVDGPYGPNGLADSVETAAESAVLNYTLDNSDGVGAPDFQDLDSDNDGVDDVDEAGLSALDADNDGDVDASADDDADGIQDGADGNTGAFGDALGLVLPDVDNDGTPDFQDNDADNDGVLDPIDNCLLIPNAGQANNDGDALGDVCDPDDDNDGVLDISDNCLLIANAGQQNSDADAQGDACDSDDDNDGLSDQAELGLGSNPTDADSDDDGVSDGVEVLPGEDSDGDGVINILDPDSDDDGLFDGTELGLGCNGAGTNAGAGNCIPDADGGATTTDPTNADTDGGGVPDGVEDANHNGVIDVGEGDRNDPNDDDSDGDGIPNAIEITLATDPLDADSDDDGVTDGQEPSFGVDSDGDGSINALDPDSDDDGILDGTELGLDCSDPATDPAAGNCVPDADAGATTTDPLDADTDGGSVDDGVEDANQNGAIDAGEGDPNDAGDDVVDDDSDDDGVTDVDETTNGTDPLDADSDDDGVTDGSELATDSDGDGDIDALDTDSDNDGLLDGTELGLDCSNPDSDPAVCVPDADGGATTTDPLNEDTDGGTVNDGDEDANHNGQIDDGETDPNLAADDVPVADSDGDGLTDDLEAALGSDPLDADSDDDGVLDGQEGSAGSDTDGDGKVNVLDPDSDGDGILDGTEMGFDCSNAATDAAAGNCVPDADGGATTTDPLDADTDGGSVNDGVEDANHNGAVDAGELDPNNGADDVAAPPAEDDGLFPEGNGILCSMGTGPVGTSSYALGALLAGLVLASARRRSRKAA